MRPVPVVRRVPGELLLALLLAGCAGEPADQGVAESAGPTSTGTYTAIDVVDGGTIVGSVRFMGSVPAARVFSIPEDVAACGATKEVGSLQLAAGRGLADAVVSLVDVSRGAALGPPDPPPTLDQRGCEFTPHVLTVAAGGRVRVLNSDPLTHNVHTASFENRSVNRSQPRGGDAIELGFTTPEKVKVQCDLHPWMSAWIVVSEHPYVAVTDADGRFALADVPPGTYTLEVWHETLGASTRSVTVTTGGAIEVSIELSGQG